MEVEGAPLVQSVFFPESRSELEIFLGRISTENKIPHGTLFSVRDKQNSHRQIASRDSGPGVEQVAKGVDVVAGRADGDDDCFF